MGFGWEGAPRVAQRSWSARVSGMKTRLSA